MQQLIQLIPIITTIPTLIFFGFITSIFTFRRPISILIINLKNVSTKNIQVIFEQKMKEVQQVQQAQQQRIEQIDERVDGLFNDHIDAYSDLIEKIESYLERDDENNISNVKIVKISIIGISMAYSWDRIVQKIPEFLRDNPNLKVNLNLFWVDSRSLELVLGGIGERTWKDISHERIENTETFINQLPSKDRERLVLQAQIYNNLPYWHGILFNSEHLYLGKVNWSFSANENPKLTAGTNNYKYFSSNDNEGKKQIEWFNSWHEFYNRPPSQIVYSAKREET